MTLFDVRCLNTVCGAVTEVSKAFEDEYPCPTCLYPDTKTLMPRTGSITVARDPYNQKQGSAPIVSYGNDRRRGGKGHGPE